MTMPELGAIFWSIASSMEAVDDRPVRPWQGKITKVVDGGGAFLPSAVFLSRFNPETGEPDRDPNATAIVGIAQLYPTERESLDEYLIAVLEASKKVVEEMAWIAETRRRLRDEEAKHGNA